MTVVMLNVILIVIQVFQYVILSYKALNCVYVDSFIAQ